MIKNALLVTALASLVTFSACDKGEKKDAEPAAKTTETAGEATGENATTPAKAETEAPTTASTMSKEEAGEKAIALFTKMGETVKAGAGDCDKIGADLQTVIAGGKDVMEAGKQFDDNPESKKWFDEKYGQQIEGIMTEMMGGLAPCMDNDAVKTAFDGLK